MNWNTYYLGPNHMISGIRERPSPEATLSSCYLDVKTYSPVVLVKVDPAWLFTFLWVFLGHSIREFAELIFTCFCLFVCSLFFLRISTLNYKCMHYVALATPRVVPVGRAKVFMWRKIVPLAKVTLPVEARQLAYQSCLAPCNSFAVRMQTVGWILQGNKLNVT